MKKRLLTFWVFVATLVSWSILPQIAAAQGNPTQPDSADHYITYTAATPPVFSGDMVILSDQFFSNVTYNVVALKKLLLPAEKFHGPVPNPMLNPDLHYKWWSLDPLLTLTRTVFVTNQFSNNSRWRILHSEFLLSPTLKAVGPSDEQPPLILPLANHYLCYRAIEDTLRPSIGIGWRDQFRTGQTGVGDAEYLCNPCQKTHFRPGLPPETFPIVNEDVHLALYRIDTAFPGIPVNIRDQFGLHNQIFVLQNGIEYIAVPSFKREPPTATRPETWGGIKSMHR
jgi:hypothetical protein